MNKHVVRVRMTNARKDMVVSLRERSDPSCKKMPRMSMPSSLTHV